MKLVRLDSLFDVKYGSNLELNALIQDKHGINFVSRTSKNNGVSAKVKAVQGVFPIEAGVLTVAAGGSVLETFLQSEPFYSGRDLYYLTPILEMTASQKLYYAKCISSNRYKYSYGRQANRTLKELLIPSLDSLPNWVKQSKIDLSDKTKEPLLNIQPASLETAEWKPFTYKDLFIIKKGKRLTKAKMTTGNTPYIGSSDANNGLTCFIGQQSIHKCNTITLSYNGSVGEAFYQPEDFWATDDVNVLYPKFKNNPAIALFICTLIKKEKYRYNYGRKWILDKMNKSIIKLPVKQDGTPDFDFMENYIKSLPYSSQID